MARRLGPYRPRPAAAVRGDSGEAIVEPAARAAAWVEHFGRPLCAEPRDERQVLPPPGPPPSEEGGGPADDVPTAALALDPWSVGQMLLRAPAGKAPGVDGLPIDLLKVLGPAAAR